MLHYFNFSSFSEYRVFACAKKVNENKMSMDVTNHRWFVEHLSQSLVAQQSVTIMNLVTPKARAKHEHTTYKPHLFLKLNHR